MKGQSSEMTMREFCSSNNCAAEHRRAAAAEETVGQVLWGFCRRPKERILRRWNWKSALLSSFVRATIFFAANLTAGHAAALAAMTREFGFRAIASGFYGGITESFRAARPRWVATLTVVVLVPILNHSAEFLVHWMLRTANLKTSIMASVCFTVLSTGFNLFAMRKDVLITSKNGGSLIGDLKMIPALLISYCCVMLCSSRLVVLFAWNLCCHNTNVFASGFENAKLPGDAALSSKFSCSGKNQKIQAA